MHHTSSAHRIKKGDLVTIEVWASYNHYVAGAQVSIYIGDSPPVDIVNPYKMLADMYIAGRDAIKPGVKSGEPWDAANKVYRASQGADYFRVVAYSTGLNWGTIRLGKGGQDILTPGQSFLLQMFVGIPACLTCTSTVIVTETGCEEVTVPAIELIMKK